MTILRVVAFFVFSLLAVVHAQTLKVNRPDFNKYPAQRIYKQKPAPPILSKQQRMFRTMIRQGAKKPVEFAGHYTVPRWGCGTGCNGFAIVDSISGRAYDAPFYVSELPGRWERTQDANAELI